MIILTKNGVRARNFDIQDEYKTKEEAQAVADRLNYQTSSKSWRVEEWQTAL